MSDRDRLASYVEAWHQACADLVALARDLREDEWHRPTDLEGWDVQDNVAHTAHLESVLAGGPEDTVEVPGDLAHVRGPMNRYTEQGVLARRGRTMAELADELEQAVEARYAALLADPPTDGSVAAPHTPGGIGWSMDTLLGNRPLDVWMHDQDVRRATDRPGGYDTVAAQHSIRRLGQGLPMVLGKRVAPPAGASVVIEVPDADYRVGAEIHDDGRAHPGLPDRPTARITLSPEGFVVLAGGRRTPDRVEAKVEGDPVLAGAVLRSLSVTP